jgi:RNA polymerase sigma factor (sigma-70 family)
MDKSDDEFAALMARVRLDDNHALATLITLYEREIWRAAQVLLGRALRSSLDPRDLVQSVHLQLILKLKQKKLAIDSPKQLRSLAVTLLRHKYIQHWRRHRCQARHSTALAMARTATGGKTSAVHELDPTWVVEYNDMLLHLHRQLRVEEHRLVIMRLQGYRMEEIAAELGIDPSVLRMRLSRLRKRLRQEKPLIEWL